MGRAPCCDKANVKKGPWSPEEDAKLKAYIELHGTGGNWIALPQKIGLKRCGKSCRLRWLNYLRPNIKHGGFSEEEDNIICSLYINIGSRWSIIAAQLPGRTDNDIKNYWNTRLKKKLLGKQRKEQARRANNNLLIKQELKRSQTDHERCHNILPAFLMTTQTHTPPYWHEQRQLPSVPLSPVANPNCYIPDKDDQDQTSMKNLLIKLVDHYEYPMVGNISTAPQVFAYDQQLDADGCGSTMFQGLENLQAELSQLIYSNDPGQHTDHGSQSFYGIDMVINGGSSSSTSACTNCPDSGSWGEMNSTVYSDPMVSDFIKTYQ